ncbi:hypothetical protein BDZ91DRAFT_801592 [Kalaharituber pfeilii]|nr:hypothetical protein BDZ91DRAFT_801592 [Kalaharituber pfeilii]
MKNLLAIISLTFAFFYQIHAERGVDEVRDRGGSEDAQQIALEMKGSNPPGSTGFVPLQLNWKHKSRGLLSEHYRRQDFLPNIHSYIAIGRVPKETSFAETGDRGGLFHTANQTTADAKIFKKNPNQVTSDLPPLMEPWMPPPAPSSWIAVLSTGFGKLTYVIEEGIECDEGLLHIIDGVFTPAGSFIEGLKVAGFTLLSTVFDTKLPALRDTLNNAPHLTFFGPSLHAVATSQSKLASLNDSEWETLLNYHTLDLTTGFIGYTPSFECGKLYKTKSGGNVLVSFKDGDTYINDAKIVGRDFILQNGVMQILDKVLELQSPDATTLPGPDGLLVDISAGHVACHSPIPSPIPEVPIPTPDASRNDSLTPTGPPPQQTGNDAVLTGASFPWTVILSLATLGFSTLL